MTSDPQAERFGYVNGEKQLGGNEVAEAGEPTEELCPSCGERLRQWIEPWNDHVFCFNQDYERDGYARDDHWSPRRAPTRRHLLLARLAAILDRWAKATE